MISASKSRALRENWVNFGAGPAALPEAVLAQIEAALWDWNGQKTSVMEMSHRSEAFMAMAVALKEDLRALLSIPDSYEILLMQGGGRGQFAMVPLNLFSDAREADYFCTGLWSMQAIEEARRYGRVRVVASSEKEQFKSIPARALWQLSPTADYVHYVANETVQGVEFAAVPDNPYRRPLVSDMSSNLLSQPVVVADHALIYAAAQKNLGIAGVTVVIVHKPILDRQALPFTPTLYRYATYARTHSLYQTPCTFAWYVLHLMLRWVRAQGGVLAMASKNKCKSDKLYRYIDESDFYAAPVQVGSRSRMNVVFTLRDVQHRSDFLSRAKKAGLLFLAGHAVQGGMRASLYNAITAQNVDRLINFMDDFARQFV